MSGDKRRGITRRGSNVTEQFLEDVCCISLNSVELLFVFVHVRAYLKP